MCERPLVALNASWIAATRVGTVLFGTMMLFDSSSSDALSLKNHVSPTTNAALLLSSHDFVVGGGGVVDPGVVDPRSDDESEVAYVGIVVWQKPESVPNETDV